MIYLPSNPQKLIQKILHELDDVMLNVGMGVGKTAPCLTAIAEKIAEGSARGALVVAPRAVANVTWPDEVDQWNHLSWMRVANLRTPEGCAEFMRAGAHVYLINYESLHILCALVTEYRKTKSKVLPFNVVVFDEITKAKNHAAKRLKLYRNVVGRVKHQWGLTGTMMPNNISDLFAMYRLLDGGRRLGTHITHFRNRFFDENTYTGFRSYELKPGAKEQIAALVSDMTVTFPSSEWLNIPPPYVEDIELEFSKSVMAQYKHLEKKLVLDLIGSGQITVPNMGNLSSKLLQFTAGSVYDEQKKAHFIHDLKGGTLEREIERSNGPTLVATQFRFELEQARKQYPQAVFFEDCVKPDVQRNTIAKWNRGEIPLIITHPAALSHGMNLQYGGHEIIWVTLTHNRDHVDQFNARLARQGQTKNVRIRRLMVEGTADYAVAGAIDYKRSEEDSLFACLKSLSASKETNLSLL